MTTQNDTELPGSVKTRVLLVEDKDEDAFIFKKHLLNIEDFVPALVHVHTLAEAVRKLGAEKFDVIFLDLNLPDNMGISTIDAIRDHAGEADIVVLTGMAGRATYEEAVKAGARIVLLKHELTPALIEAYLPM